MNDIRLRRLRGTFGVLLLLLLVAVPCISTAACTLEQLESARSRWAASAPRHFVYTLVRSTGMIVNLYKDQPIPNDVQVEVRNGKVRTVTYASDHYKPHKAGSAVSKRMWQSMTLHPEQLFAEVHAAILEANQDPIRIIRCEFFESGLLRSLETDVRGYSDSFRGVGITEFRELQD